LGHSKLLRGEMTASPREHFDNVFLELQKFGMLLLSDSSLPSVRDLISNRHGRGSWWSDESAQTIFAVSEMLEDHPDVLIMKLISEKVTFVHRELWGRVYSIGVAREDWQTNNLSPSAKQLLKKLDADGWSQTNKLGQEFGPKPGETVRELEMRLLLHAQQIHTPSGAHAKVIETWDVWAERMNFHARPKSPAAARRFLEQRLAEMPAQFRSYPRFPWTSKI
jgi:hypothetical protein